MLHSDVTDEEDMDYVYLADSVDDRRKRSRERNRLHARKTRQRKKAQIESLQDRIRALKREGDLLHKQQKEQEVLGTLALMQSHAAAVPAAVAAAHGAQPPQDEAHMGKISELAQAAIAVWAEADWAAQLSEHCAALTALMNLCNTMDSQYMASLSDAAAAERARSGGGGGGAAARRAPPPSAALRAQLRRERNRMHAKRARDRKKLLVDASTAIVGVLDARNALARAHLRRAALSLPPALAATLSTAAAAPSSPYAEDDAASDPLPEDVFELWEYARTGPLPTPQVAVPPRQLPPRGSRGVVSNGGGGGSGGGSSSDAESGSEADADAEVTSREGSAASSEDGSWCGAGVVFSRGSGHGDGGSGDGGGGLRRTRARGGSAARSGSSSSSSGGGVGGGSGGSGSNGCAASPGAAKRARLDVLGSCCAAEYMEVLGSGGGATLLLQAAQQQQRL
ncbi:hypothetical protein JKP88DRAFT_347454 [Tribonema minus]|uniref:BZIP domain-containing protein n=1 Tax=Tribonema minus TaxID=303371 RepID=A0A835ZF21_9STRA|nr:hypothetical protein JKP88DRAFT_347454 [Tribonema minus]